MFLKRAVKASRAATLLVSFAAAQARSASLTCGSAADNASGVLAKRYVRGGGVNLAFQTYGACRIDVLVLPGFVSHVERVGQEPQCRALLFSLA